MADHSPIETIPPERRKYDFDWESMGVIIGGTSVIDTRGGLSGCAMHTSEDASRFLESYGYVIDDPIEAAEVLGNFHEALNFIRSTFLQPGNPDGARLQIPRKIVEITDFKHLLMMAAMTYPGQMSDLAGRNLRDWACAVLKVVHTIAHIDKDLKVSYFTDVQKQIFDRFYRLIHRDDQENLHLCEKLGDPAAVPLVAFQTKPKKSRESILLKMLHKQENATEDIFDRVGIRFITKSKFDVLRVIKVLKDNMAIMSANVRPKRSRNTLFQLDRFIERYQKIHPDFVDGEITEEEFLARMSDSIEPMPRNPEVNPHSSEHYRSIQFTGTQLIKLKNPLFESIRNLNSIAKKEELSEKMSTAIKKVDMKFLKREVRFFYPFEVQIMDELSHEENEKGRSAHSEYKRAQIRTAMGRVLGPLLKAEELASQAN